MRQHFTSIEIVVVECSGSCKNRRRDAQDRTGGRWSGLGLNGWVGGQRFPAILSCMIDLVRMANSFRLLDAYSLILAPGSC